MDKEIKDFKFKKQFGQNFIFDKNFLESLVKTFNLDREEEVLEIGAGAGTLTEVLANNFKKVVSVEIDKTLKDRLLEIKEKYNNLSFIFDDVMKIGTAEIDNFFGAKGYNIIANLPYYITSQIVFKFLLESKKLKKMIVMVQKEVGERYSAMPGSREYGVPSVLIDTFGKAQIVKNVNRKMFTPEPKVDSCMIKITIDKNKNKIYDASDYCKFVTGCFMMKRKTLYNNLIKQGYSKDKVFDLLKDLNIIENIRPEKLSSEQYVKLYKMIKE